MRPNEHRVDLDGTSIDGFVRLLDNFAAIPARAPTRHARDAHGGPHSLRITSKNPPSATMLARAGFAAFLLILLMGGLGFAIWAGPQGCLGCDDALVVARAAQASNGSATASRFQYTATAGFAEMLKQQPSQWAHDWGAPSKKAQVRRAELLRQPVPGAAQAEDSIALSPMTTSATGRLYDPQSLTKAKPPWHSGRRPEVAAEVSDAALKPLKLTAANEISKRFASPPSVLAVKRSPVNGVDTIDGPVRKPKASSAKRRQLKSQRHRRAARARKRVKASQMSSVPRWAKKMFNGTWQDRAFSYQYQ